MFVIFFSECYSCQTHTGNSWGKRKTIAVSYVYSCKII